MKIWPNFNFLLINKKSFEINFGGFENFLAKWGNEFRSLFQASHLKTPRKNPCVKDQNFFKKTFYCENNCDRILWLHVENGGRVKLADTRPKCSHICLLKPLENPANFTHTSFIFSPRVKREQKAAMLI